MAVKKEQVSPVPEQDFLSVKKTEPQEQYLWTPPLKSGPKAVECWMAPVKPERSLMRKIVKEENSWIRVVADCVEKAKNSPKVDDCAQCNDSPLRSCPKFEKMSDNAEEVYNMVGKTKNEEKSNDTVVDESDQLVQNPGDSCATFEKTSDSADDNCKKTSKTRVDFSDGEFADDVEDEHDNTCIIGSKYGVVNTRCPLSGKLVTKLDDPVQSVSCHHVYEQASAKAYINEFSGICKCAVAGCSKSLILSDLVCDTTLTESIQDLRQKDFATKLKLLMECIQLDDE